ncbi:MAG TPA: transglutaminase domain-containing protein [Phycisphaerales bacterium]|nr:transglutaminase domain-containing protein [Phycisphaerales bacterium]HMP36454.1 transglutaminase domain-containing protein [Phycisphaerales bacterium]
MTSSPIRFDRAATGWTAGAGLIAVFARTSLACLALLVGSLRPADAGAAEAAATRARSEGAANVEAWYELRLGNVHCGWMRTATVTQRDRVSTSSETVLRLDRAGERVTIELSSEFVETLTGHPVSMSVRSATGGPPVTTRWTFPAGGERGGGGGESPSVAVVERQGDRERRSEEPLPAGEWLPPAAAERFFAERRAAGATEVSYRVVDGQAGLRAAKVSARRVGEGRFRIETGAARGERELPTTIWEIATDLVPVASTIELTSDGRIVRSFTMLGAERLESVLSTRDRARRLGSAPAPDLISSTMNAPDRPIQRPHATRRARYRIEIAEGELPELPEAGAQRVERDGPSAAILLVDVGRPLAASEAERGDPAYRAASALIDFDDPDVIALTERALGRGSGRSRPAAPAPSAAPSGQSPPVAAPATLETAERLRAFVVGHIRDKGLATAFAGAAETARSRAGDCTEHAVLLAAMLRAAGIPARIGVGLVYADRFAGRRDVFAWHMWTQALIEDAEGTWRWIDLDATLDGRSFHAAHILTATTSLAEGPLDPRLVGIIPMLGRLSIKVLEVDHGRRP